jgi:rare lipoprotein A
VASFLLVGVTELEAKTPGKTYCFKKVCHEETWRDIGRTRIVTASYYDDAKVDPFNPRNVTSSGEIYNPSRPDNAASPEYPDGTKLLVWSPEAKKTLVVRVNTAGPYYGQRKLDLSRAAAETLGFRRQGVTRLHVRVLEPPTIAEARHRRGRTYAAVPGFVGMFESVDSALVGVGRALASLLVAPAVGATPVAIPPHRARGRVASAGRHKPVRAAQLAARRKQKAVASRYASRRYKLVARASVAGGRRAGLHLSSAHKGTAHKRSAYKQSAHKRSASKSSGYKLARYTAKRHDGKRDSARSVRQ